MAIKSAEEDDIEEEAENENETLEEKAAAVIKHKAAKNSKTKVSWVGSAVCEEGKKFYTKARINDFEVSFFF